MQVNTQTKTPVAVVVLQWHKDIAKAVIHGVTVVETVANKCKALVTATYGMVPPTFAQYKSDLKAFSAIAEAGKVSEQNLHKAYREAVKSLFGEQLTAEGSPSGLPVSQEPDAVLKRAERKAKDEKIAEGLKLLEVKATTTPVGAPKGETQPRQPSEAEQVEQIIARIGWYECLYACIRIAAADKTTASHATHLRSIADAMRKAQDAAEQVKRVAAIKPTAPVTTIITPTGAKITRDDNVIGLTAAT